MMKKNTTRSFRKAGTLTLVLALLLSIFSMSAVYAEESFGADTGAPAVVAIPEGAVSESGETALDGDDAAAEDASKSIGDEKNALVLPEDPEISAEGSVKVLAAAPDGMTVSIPAIFPDPILAAWVEIQLGQPISYTPTALDTVSLFRGLALRLKKEYSYTPTPPLGFHGLF